MTRWLLAASLGAALPIAAARQASLDAVLASYTGGDHAVVARTFARSHDFQRLRLADRRHLTRWLGAWDPAKAKLAIELAVRAAETAPAYVVPLVSTGRDYLLARADAPGRSVADDELERRWHGLALGVLQTSFFDGEIERYLEALAARRPLPSAAAVWPPRAEFARAIAHEQRCRQLHSAARHDRLTADGAFAAATPPAEREGAITCVQMALARYEAARRAAASRDEARVRAGWALFQLGQNDQALQTLDGIDPGDDRVLGYWLALFRARTADAMGVNGEAEEGYRRALALFPDAHTATVGLAVTLFRMQRDDEAEEVAGAARRRAGAATDPWEVYSYGDARLLPQWLTELRGSRP